jgi:hypothetical protein
LLVDDPELRALATEYGFRTTDAAGFRTYLKDHGATAPDTLIDVIDPPTYERLEAMITRLEQLYASGSSALPGSLQEGTP